MDILTLIYSVLLLYLLTQEAAGNGVMVYYAAIQGKKKKAGLYIFKQPISKASVAFTNDILLAFGESVNHMLFHGWTDGI